MAGLDFYSRVVDELLRQGIEPYVTLYHWDLRQALQYEGGWSVRDKAEAFVQFADVVTKLLSDHAKRWVT